MPKFIQAAFVRNSADASALTSDIAESPRDFRCIPRSVIPFTVLCQGLLK